MLVAGGLIRRRPRLARGSESMTATHLFAPSAVPLAPRAHTEDYRAKDPSDRSHYLDLSGVEDCFGWIIGPAPYRPRSPRLLGAP